MVDVDDVHSNAVASDDATAIEVIDRFFPDLGILSDDRVGIRGCRNDVVLTLALCGHQFEARPADDGALDLHVAEIVVRNHDGTCRTGAHRAAPLGGSCGARVLRGVSKAPSDAPQATRS